MNRWVRDLSLWNIDNIIYNSENKYSYMYICMSIYIEKIYIYPPKFSHTGEKKKETL